RFENIKPSLNKLNEKLPVENNSEMIIDGKIDQFKIDDFKNARKDERILLKL
ncbi:4305_t:CDS:2, partial [Gigaspora margarita]